MPFNFGQKITSGLQNIGQKISGGLKSVGNFGQKLSTSAGSIINPLYNLNQRIQADPTAKALADTIPGYSTASDVINVAKSYNDRLGNTSAGLTAGDISAAGKAAFA